MQGRTGVFAHANSKNEIKTLYMKKVYIAPLATEVNVEATNMLAASLKLSDQTVDTSNGGQLSNGHRGGWGNLWQ